jgi:hypothetical protein
MNLAAAIVAAKLESRDFPVTLNSIKRPEMDKRHDIKKRELDGKWVVWTQVDDPEADLDYYRKSGLPIPQRWVPIAVESTEEDAKAASRRSRI